MGDSLWVNLDGQSTSPPLEITMLKKRPLAYAVTRSAVLLDLYVDRDHIIQCSPKVVGNRRPAKTCCYKLTKFGGPFGKPFSTLLWRRPATTASILINFNGKYLLPLISKSFILKTSPFYHKYIVLKQKKLFINYL